MKPKTNGGAGTRSKTDSPSSTVHRVSKLEQTISSLKRQLTIVAIISAMVGGGGVFGIVQWASTVPVNRATEEAELSSTRLDDILNRHNETLASLEGSIKRLEDGDPQELDELRGRLELTEASLRDTLQNFDETRQAFSDTSNVIKSQAAEIAQFAEAIQEDNTEIVTRLESLGDRLRSLGNRSRLQTERIKQVEKKASDFDRALKDLKLSAS